MQHSTVLVIARRTGSLVRNRTVPAILSSNFPRYATTEAVSSNVASPPPPPGASDPKLNRLVDDISSLTLLQAADFVSLLKVGRSSAVTSWKVSKYTCQSRLERLAGPDTPSFLDTSQHYRGGNPNSICDTGRSGSPSRGRGTTPGGWLSSLTIDVNTESMNVIRRSPRRRLCLHCVWSHLTPRAKQR
jgi:hypothetical protein